MAEATSETFKAWRDGCGPIRHGDETVERIQALAASNPPGWTFVPLVVTSHTWENAKNKQSHQDPTIGKALPGDMSDTSRVLFPVDASRAIATLWSVYRGRGPVACLIVSKCDMPYGLDAAATERFVSIGVTHVDGEPDGAELQFLGAPHRCVHVARRMVAQGTTPPLNAMQSTDLAHPPICRQQEIEK